VLPEEGRATLRLGAAQAWTGAGLLQVSQTPPSGLNKLKQSKALKIAAIATVVLLAGVVVYCVTNDKELGC
jgi:hypothetical protein